LNKCNEPSFYEEVVKDVNWINAMNEEMHALYDNKTWTMTDLPYERRPIGFKWVFRIKYKSNSEVERYKARLVAKGFSQKEGIDYEETFSHVVKMNTVRCLINLAGLDKSLYGVKQDPTQWNHKLSEALLEHMHAPLKSHFDVDMKVLKYLKLAPSLGVNFSKRKSYCLITAFSDSDWAKCQVTRRSVLGYCVYINGNLISWKSKRQATLSRSSVEAE
nr:putative reverse transcriptase, RNA-dependent DNA polymerase, Gag-polypeptide of LTR copia-type [Tanacetum cinerariifolium]